MSKAQYRFGPFELDANTLELRRDGVAVVLQPRPTVILVALVARGGEMVTRRELLEIGWPRLPDAADLSLNTCIRQIRDALGDDAAQPDYIETLRGRGYRFAQPVATAPTPVASAVDAPSPRWRRRVVRFALSLGAVLLISGIGRILLRTGPHVVARVVIPAPQIIGDVPQRDDISTAIAAELRASMATVAPARVHVLGRETTERLIDAGELARDAAVPVTHVLELTVQPLNDELRILAQLLDRGTGVVVWADGVHTTSATLGAASASLTRGAARALGVTRDARIVSNAVPLDVRAHLLKARYVLEQRGDLSTALAHIDSVVERHPGVAEAHGLRAEALVFHNRPADAREAAALALQLDVRDRGALRATGWLHMLNGEWHAARRALDKALHVAPNDPITLSAVAFLSTTQGGFAEAALTIERAVAIDPLAALLVADAGLLHLVGGRTDDAIRACSEAVALRPDATWAIGCSFDAELIAGRTSAAATWGRRLLSAFGADTIASRATTDAELVAAIRRWRLEAREAAVAAGAGDAYSLAIAYADAGRTNDALTTLERAVGDPGLALLTVAVDPRLRVLHREDRFRAILTRLNMRRIWNLSRAAGDGFAPDPLDAGRLAGIPSRAGRGAAERSSIGRTLRPDDVGD